MDDAQRARLEEMLRRGQMWRQRYLSYVDLHATLWLLGGDPNALGVRDGRQSAQPAASAKLPSLGPLANAEVAHVRGLIESTADAEAQETARRARLFMFLGDLADHSASLFRPPLVFFTLLVAVFLGALATYQFSGKQRQTAVGRESLGDRPGRLLSESESGTFPAAYLTLVNVAIGAVRRQMHGPSAEAFAWGTKSCCMKASRNFAWPAESR